MAPLITRGIVVLRKLLVALGIAASATAISAPASATTYFLDVHDLGDSDTFTKSNTYFRGFTDIYLFNVSQAGFINGYVSSFATLPKLDAYLKEITLDGVSLVRTSGGALENWAANNIHVGPGKHKLSIVGYWGKEGGTYSSKLSFDAAVPEPASWAMMIAGFGLVGAAMRRRTKVQVRYA